MLNRTTPSCSGKARQEAESLSCNRPMDLRRTLVIRLAISFLLLILVFSGIWLIDLRKDALAEEIAASRLVDLLLAADGPNAQTEVAKVLRQGDLRHIEATLLHDGETAPAPKQSDWIARLGLSTGPSHDYRIPLGDRTLLIRPDPESEFREKLGASVQVLTMLLVFCMASLGLTWFAAHRALSPVKELEAGLLRLEVEENSARLPQFALREFTAIAGVVDRLAASLNRAREKQHLLTRQLMEVQDKERRELAAELHDEFGQSLAAISASAAYIERHAPETDPSVLIDCAREIGGESRRISGHVRQMLSSLRPYGIEDSGIGESLSELLAGWKARLPDWRIESRIDPLPSLPAPTGLALYRSLQEALTNCVRHSGADHIGVQCTLEGDWIRLSVVDNGNGNARLLSEQSGSGLLGLRERLTMIGGNLAIEDGELGGIVLIARVPAPIKAES